MSFLPTPVVPLMCLVLPLAIATAISMDAVTNNNNNISDISMHRSDTHINAISQTKKNPNQTKEMFSLLTKKVD